jgi:MFS family permease
LLTPADDWNGSAVATTESSELARSASAANWRPAFRLRWAAFTTSEVGSALGYQAVPIVALLVLGVSDFQVSALTVLAGVVSAAVALPLGPWIEHHRKLPVMVAADLLRFVAVASVPAAAYLGVLTYWQLCAVAVLRMAGTLVFDSASVANLRTLVPQRHRAEANSRFETTLWTANTVGPPTGGVLISWWGATVTMVLDAASFAVSAMLLGRFHAAEPAPPRRAAEHHWFRDLTAGWRYILQHRGLAALFWNSLIFGGCIMALTPLLTVFVLRDLGFSPWQYGLVSGASGVAGVVGSTIAGPTARRIGEHRVLLLAGAGRNLWLILIPLAPASNLGLIMIVASEVLLILFAGLFNPAFATYRMNTTDDAHMSRVVMAWSVTSKVVQPLFIAGAGALAAVSNARTALIGLAVVLLTATAFLPWRS